MFFGKSCKYHWIFPEIICQWTTSSNFRTQGCMDRTACNWPLKEPTSGTTSQGRKNSPQKKMQKKKLVHLKIIHPQQEKERNIHKIDPNHPFLLVLFQPLIFAAPGIWTPKQPWLHPPKRWHSSVKHFRSWKNIYNMPAKTPNSMEMYHLMLFGEKNLGWPLGDWWKIPSKEILEENSAIIQWRWREPFAGSCLHRFPTFCFHPPTQEHPLCN